MRRRECWKAEELNFEQVKEMLGPSNPLNNQGQEPQ
jgi:hypothetical protein